MKTKYTPGPWICHSGMVWKPDDTGDGTPIARMDRDTDKTAPTERDANARLIAAAPELKAALVECVQVLGEYTGPSLNGLNSAFENAITAIAKSKEDE